MALLEVKNLNVKYGFIQALSNVNIQIEEGQMVALLGANGAGKSSLLKAIIGNAKAQKGSEIIFDEKNITNASNQKLCKNTKQIIASIVFTIKYLYRFS